MKLTFLIKGLSCSILAALLLTLIPTKEIYSMDSHPSDLHNHNHKLIENLSFFLSSCNEYISDHMLEKEVFSGRDFNAFIETYYGISESFTDQAKEISKGLTATGITISEDPNTREGLQAIFNYLLSPIEERIELGEEEYNGNKNCYTVYVTAHQSCLIDGVLDGIFDRMNTSVGSSFMNCIRITASDFSQCVGQNK